MLDIISPCVTFNNNEDSTKSYAYGKANEERLHDITFVPRYEEITVDYDPGTTVSVEMHDGSTIHLKKLDQSYDPTDPVRALNMLQEAQAHREFITGLVYINEARPTLVEVQQLAETPLVQLDESRLRPSREALAKAMAALG
jgi:2-oxoglutarate ferredoxin oxidoreductase subunit beta